MTNTRGSTGLSTSLIKASFKDVVFHRDQAVPKRRQESAADGRDVIKDSSIVGRIKAPRGAQETTANEWARNGRRARRPIPRHDSDTARALRARCGPAPGALIGVPFPLSPAPFPLSPARGEGET